MRTLRLAAVSAALLAMTTPAVADTALSDYFGPRELSVGESARAEATGARAITLNPAGLALTRQLVFEGSYGFRPEDSASSLAVSACDSTNAMPGCYYYRYFSAEPTIGASEFSRRAHEFGVSLSRALSEQLALGITSKYFDYNSDMLGEEDADGFNLDAGLVFKPSSAVSLGAVGYNLVGADSPQYPRALGGGMVIRPVPALGISADAVWNLELPDDQTAGRYGGGIEYFYRNASKLAGYPLRAGAVFDNPTDSTWITAGVGFTNPKMAIDIGARKQVDGGDELLVLAGLRLFGPTQ
jgi:hypothetical protein